MEKRGSLEKAVDTCIALTTGWLGTLSALLRGAQKISFLCFAGFFLFSFLTVGFFTFSFTWTLGQSDSQASQTPRVTTYSLRKATTF